jgi:hypothetical protein
MKRYWVSYDKEGRIRTVNAMDDSVLDTHPEKAGDARLFLMRKGPQNESIPDEQLYAKIERQAGHQHYVEDGKRIKAKTALKLTLDKATIKPDGADVATVTWNAPDPIQMFCNGRLKGRFNNSLQVFSKHPGIFYRIEVDDPKYYSEALWLRTQETEQLTSPSSTSP